MNRGQWMALGVVVVSFAIWIVARWANSRTSPPHALGVEGGEYFAPGPRPKRTAKHVHHAVHMVQWKYVQNVVLVSPLPGIDKHLDLRSNHGMRRDSSLGFIRRAARVNQHCAPRRVDIWQRLVICGARPIKPDNGESAV